MKYATILLTSFLFFVGSFGLTFGNTTLSSMDPNPIEWSLTTAEEHLSQAQNLEQEIERLENKVSELNQKVARYNKKPYLDTKGVQRNGLKLLIGSSVKKIKNIRELVAWHRAEATRLAAVEKGSQKSTSDSQETSRISRDHSPLPSHSESSS